MFLIFLVLFFSSLATANEEIPPAELPKLEVGLAFGYFNLPDYPGGSERSTRVLALPSIVYRGEIFRADRDGWRGQFLKNDNYEFDLSFGAAFPTDSNDNGERAGMPDLDWVGEVGPRLNLHLLRQKNWKLDLALPIRYVFSTDIKNWHERGYVFNPNFAYRYNLKYGRLTFLGARIGATWSTEELADYFYQVKSQYATATRTTYDAQGGYFGTNCSLFVIKNISKAVTAFAGLSKNYYADSKNRKSPLLTDVETESYFLGLNWTLYTKGRSTNPVAVSLNMNE